MRFIYGEQRERMTTEEVERYRKAGIFVEADLEEIMLCRLSGGYQTLEIIKREVLAGRKIDEEFVPFMARSIERAAAVLHIFTVRDRHRSFMEIEERLAQQQA